MVTGLVERTGEIASIEAIDGGTRVGIEMGEMALEISIGDSICTSGVCITVVSIDNTRSYFDLSPQTLEVTNFDVLLPGSKVNLERSLRVGDRLGGHFLSGHVDDIGTLLEIKQLGGFSNYIFSAPSKLLPLMVDKGSIGVDGVSLTIARLDDGGSFEVALIPETLSSTNLGSMQVGCLVHLEADILAKHVQRLLAYK